MLRAPFFYGPSCRAYLSLCCVAVKNVLLCIEIAYVHGTDGLCGITEKHRAALSPEKHMYLYMSFCHIFDRVSLSSRFFCQRYSLLIYIFFCKLTEILINSCTN